MGGVDKSDQYISYNRILRKTVRYWKTFLYHLLEIIATNSSILYNWHRMELEQKSVSQTQFRDILVQQIITKYGITSPDPGSFAVVHGSQFREDTTKRRCAYCQSNQTQRYCPHCPYEPSLCQVSERDCHSIWHREASSKLRKRWFKNHARSHARNQTPPAKASTNK